MSQEEEVLEELLRNAFFFSRPTQQQQPDSAAAVSPRTPIMIMTISNSSSIGLHHDLFLVRSKTSAAVDLVQLSGSITMRTRILVERVDGSVHIDADGFGLRDYRPPIRMMIQYERKERGLRVTVPRQPTEQIKEHIVMTILKDVTSRLFPLELFLEALYRRYGDEAIIGKDLQYSDGSLSVLRAEALVCGCMTLILEGGARMTEATVVFHTTTASAAAAAFSSFGGAMTMSLSKISVRLPVQALIDDVLGLVVQHVRKDGGSSRASLVKELRFRESTGAELTPKRRGAELWRFLRPSSWGDFVLIEPMHRSFGGGLQLDGFCFRGKMMTGGGVTVEWLTDSNTVLMRAYVRFTPALPGEIERLFRNHRENNDEVDVFFESILQDRNSNKEDGNTLCVRAFGLTGAMLQHALNVLVENVFRIECACAALQAHGFTVKLGQEEEEVEDARMIRRVAFDVLRGTTLTTSVLVEMQGYMTEALFSCVDYDGHTPLLQYRGLLFMFDNGLHLTTQRRIDGTLHLCTPFSQHRHVDRFVRTVLLLHEYYLLGRQQPAAE